MATINLTPDAAKPVSVSSPTLPAGFSTSLGTATEGNLGTVVLKGTGAAASKGEYAYQVTASNGSITSGNLDMTISLPMTVDPTSATLQGYNGIFFSRTVASAYGDEIEGLENADLGNGLTVDLSGIDLIVNGTPTAVGETTHVVTVVGVTGGRAEFTVNFTALETPDGPEFTPEEPDYRNRVGAQKRVVLGYVSGSAAVSVGAKTGTAPAGVIIELATSENPSYLQEVVASGTPTAVAALSTVTFTLTNEFNQTSDFQATFEVAVKAPVLVPTAKAFEVVAGAEQNEVLTQVMNVAATSFSITPALPSNLSLQLIATGNTAPTGTTNVPMTDVVLKGDIAQARTAASYVVTVSIDGEQDQVLNLDLTFVSGALVVTPVGEPDTLWTNYANVNTPLFTFGGQGVQNVTGNAPAGTTLEVVGNTICLNGTPTAQAAGAHFKITVAATANDDSVVDSEIDVVFVEGVHFAPTTASAPAVSERATSLAVAADSTVTPSASNTVLSGAPAWVTMGFSAGNADLTIVTPKVGDGGDYADGEEVVFYVQTTAEGGPTPFQPGQRVTVTIKLFAAAVVPAVVPAAVDATAEHNYTIDPMNIMALTNVETISVNWGAKVPPGIVVQKVGSNVVVSGKVDTGTVDTFAATITATSASGDTTTATFDLAVTAPIGIVIDPATALVRADVGQEIDRVISEVKTA